MNDELKEKLVFLRRAAQAKQLHDIHVGVNLACAFFSVEDYLFQYKREDVEYHAEHGEYYVKQAAKNVLNASPIERWKSRLKRLNIVHCFTCNRKRPFTYFKKYHKYVCMTCGGN